MNIRRMLTTAATAALLVFPAAAASAHTSYDGGTCEPGYALAEDDTCVPDTYWDEPLPEDSAHPDYNCAIDGNRTCAYPVLLDPGVIAWALSHHDEYGALTHTTWRDSVDVYGMSYPAGTDAHGTPVYVFADTSADQLGYAAVPTGTLPPV